ncbi:MAG: hypothetical protein [Olavius algarvensis Delta 4 endosymbiont]|nr:MAG: hypothetical protein [Olavius algarvensis Delta 4 endosymbiont]
MIFVKQGFTVAICSGHEKSFTIKSYSQLIPFYFSFAVPDHPGLVPSGFSLQLRRSGSEAGAATEVAPS